MRFLIHACILFLFFSAVTASAEEPLKEPPLRGPYWTEQAAQIGFLSARIEFAEKEAIQLLKNPKGFRKRPKGVYYAITFLGTIRSRDGVPVLCDCLLYEQEVRPMFSPMGNFERRPASFALFQIGTPAVDGLLKKIAASDTSEEYQHVAMYVLRHVLGKEKVPKAIKEFSKEKSTEERQQQRLEAFEKSYKKGYTIK